MNQGTASGLYDFPAREYGIQGRWPSPDPAGLAAVDPTNPQSWNRYAYVLNNPLNFIGPSGMGLCDVHVWDYPGCVGGPGFFGFGPSMSCYQDSVATDCGQVLRDIDLGTAAVCPNNDCTGIKAGQGPAGTTMFQQWTPGGCVSTQDSRSGTGDSTCYAGYWSTLISSNSNGPLTDDARLPYIGRGVIKGAGVIGSPKHIVGFYLTSALLGDMVAGG
jgi:RHS repeat-associated protein